MFVILEYVSLSVYAVTLFFCFVLGLARGKRTRKVVVHAVFFCLAHLILLCWLGATASYTIVRLSDGVRVDMVFFAKNVVFSAMCTFVVTSIVNKWSAFTVVHGVNFVLAYFSLYKAMLADEYPSRVTWLEVSGVLMFVRFVYLFKEIVDGRKYDPWVAKIVAFFVLAYNVAFFVLLTMSPFFQVLISQRAMSLSLSIIDLLLIPTCSFIVVHYNWISVSLDYADSHIDTTTHIKQQRILEEKLASKKLSRQEIMHRHHTYIN